MESHHDKLLHISSNGCLLDRFTDSANTDSASQGTALGRAALHFSNKEYPHPNLERMQLHKLCHLCLFNHPVFNNTYSNSVFGQRRTRKGFYPMELCQHLTTTPVAQANFRLSEILESFLKWHPQHSASLQIYFHRN